ncbi:MAG: hypothetical protein HYY68_08335, partial [Thaumarchaeota archaeon]|nr:hypothetical protein [Nitrososphaerota archaeon]
MARITQVSGSGNFRLYLFDTFVGNAMIPVFNIFLPILAIQIGADALQVGLVGGTANAVYA